MSEPPRRIDWVIWGCAIAVSAGCAILALAHPEQVARLAGNTLGRGERRNALAWVVGVASVLVIAAAIWLRSQREAGPLAANADRINRILAPLCIVPFALPILGREITRQEPNLTIFLIGGATLVAFVAGSRWSLPRGLPKLPTWAPWVVLFAAWWAYGLFFTHLSVVRHHALQSGTADLGYYDQIFFNSSHGRPLVCSLCRNGAHWVSHFDPILVLLSPLYHLYPRAELLLVLQSFWLGSSIFPVYLLGKRLMGRVGASLLLAVSVLLYPAQQGMNLFDFHSLVLLGPLVVWLCFFYFADAPKRFWFLALLCALTREDVAFLLVLVAVVIFLEGDARWRRRAIGLGLGAVAYFVLVKSAVMTSSDLLNCADDGPCYRYYYKELIRSGEGTEGLLISILTDPASVLAVALTQEKALFLAQLFLPMAFIPFFVRRWRLTLAFGLAFCLLASHEAVFSLGFQYPSFLYPIGFVLTAIGLGRLEPDKRRGALWAIATASVLCALSFGGIVDKNGFQTGYDNPVRELTAEQAERYEWVAETIAKVPTEAGIAASKRLGAHLSNRQRVERYPDRGLLSFDYAFVDREDLTTKDKAELDAKVGSGEYLRLEHWEERYVLYRIAK